MDRLTIAYQAYMQKVEALAPNWISMSSNGETTTFVYLAPPAHIPQTDQAINSWLALHPNWVERRERIKRSVTVPSFEGEPFRYQSSL